jgi:hypothetical protein
LLSSKRLLYLFHNKKMLTVNSSPKASFFFLLESILQWNNDRIIHSFLCDVYSNELIEQTTGLKSFFLPYTTLNYYSVYL